MLTATVAVIQSDVPPMEVVIALAAVLVVLVLVYGLVRRYIPTYNDLVDFEENVKQAKGNVDALLQRRQDQLNRLSIAVREATGHESTTLNEVIQAREALNSGAAAEQAQAGQNVQRALMQLDARSEEYPEVDAIGNIQTLQENIVSIEEELAEARKEYNGEVTTYNKKIRKFPESVMARLGGFEEKEQFEPSEDILAGETMGLDPSLGPSTGPKRTLEPSAEREPAIEDHDDGRRALETTEVDDPPDER